MTNYKKYVITKWAKNITGVIAFFLFTAGICLVDSPSLIPMLTMIGCGIPFALAAFFFKAVSLRFLRLAKKDIEKRKKQEVRNRTVFSGDYTKIVPKNIA